VKTRVLRGFLASLVAIPLAVAAAGAARAATPRVLAVEFDNDVNPVTAEFVVDAIDRANDEKFDAVVLLLDTPGGLGSSMEKIYKRELASRVPVIVYVSPAGGNAASAGVFIAQAGDVLAMAPQTTIGASTPISSGGGNLPSDERRKAINFYAGKLRGLAGTHGRNAKWADRAVRQASSLSASEALRQDVVDLVAPSLPALLQQVDGRRTVPKGIVLHTAGAQLVRVRMSLWKRILDTLIDPNIIALLLSLGALGIVVELWNPGLIFPGTVGGISLILGLFGLSVLPVSWAGILLMLLAAGFFAAEPFIVSHGALSLAGAVSFVLGALLLFDPAGPNYQVSLWVALSIAGTIGAFMAFAMAKVVQVRRKPVEVGLHRMVGSTGVVRRDGYVLAHGELWRAHPVEGAELVPGEQVVVEQVNDGLVLEVRPVGSAS
jgi:membrane-bound serine protease (ClpP class)